MLLKKSTILALIFFIISINFIKFSFSQVVDLTNSNFEQEVNQNNPGVVIVEFYAPWCGHCKRLAPQYDAAAKSLGGIVKFAKINCDDEAALAQQFGIKGFPTIKVFTFLAPGEKPTVDDYQGPREAKSLVNFALTKFADILDPVRKVTADLTESEKRKFDAHYTVALFTKKDKNPNLFKSLAIEIRKKSEFFMRKVNFLFIQEDDSRKNWISTFGITKSPSIIILKPKAQGNEENNNSFEGRFVKYDSDNFQRSSILKFIYENIVEESIPKETQAESEKPQEYVPKFEAKEISGVQDAIQLCSGFCLIGFYSNDEQKKAFIEEGRKQSTVKVGIINKNNLSAEHETILKAFNQESIKNSANLSVLGLKLKKKRYFFEDIEILDCKKLFDKAIDGVGLKFNSIDEEILKNLA